MMKRAIAIALVGLGVAVMQVGETRAHGIPVYGYYYPGSIISDAQFKGIQDPTQHPGEAEWIVEVQEYQFLCYNPAGNQASLQVMLREATVAANQPFTQGDWTKHQGRLTFEGVTIETDFLVTADDLACDTQGGGHHNWIPQPETLLVTKFKGTISAYECDDELCSSRTLMGQLVQQCDFVTKDEPYSCYELENLHAKTN